MRTGLKSGDDEISAVYKLSLQFNLPPTKKPRFEGMRSDVTKKICIFTIRWVVYFANKRQNTFLSFI